MSAPESAGRMPAIQAVGLGHRFNDGVWAFRDIDIALFPGEVTVLAGRNGAGKTFLAKTLAGLLDPTEGKVLVRGVEMRAIRGPRAKKVGYLFQDARLQTVGETVLDDVLFGPTNLGLPEAEALSRAKTALLACGLADFEHSFVHRLSGGELRRLAMAGLLAMMPDVMILDEPFANLDVEGVRSVLKIVLEMAGKGIAILVVTHEVEKVIGIAHAFVVLDGGDLVLSGEPSAVLAQGIESFGLRDPFHAGHSFKDLTWLD